MPARLSAMLARANRTVARVSPFRGLPNPREVWAWGMYDLANQSFTLLIITLLFSNYFKSHIASANGDALWAYASSGSLALVVILSPFLGACADAYGFKKRFLLISGLLCASLTCAMALLGHGDVAAGMALFVAGNLCYQLGENVLAGFLPEISTPRNIGRISATGWTMGYIGSLSLLVLVVVGMLIFGLAPVERWPPFFVLAGVWFALGMIAPMVVLNETPARRLGTDRTIAGATWSRLADTVRNAAHYRQLSRFLAAFFVYAFGVQTIIYFAGIIAKDFGLDGVQLLVFALQLSVTAAAAAIGTGVFQDRIGAKTTVVVYLVVWIVTALGLLGLTLIPASARSDNQWAFWVVGNGVGLGLGGIGTASRSMVGRFTPRHKTAEFFGLWGMTYKSAGVVGVLIFGQIKQSVSDTAAMGALTAFFVVGLLFMLRVNERAGVRAALRSQRNAASATLRP